jgi:tetratricopeptide (TPR) repeat protein
MKIQTPKELSKAGETAYQAGDYLEAAQHFEVAAMGHAAQGENLMAAEMSNNQSVALLQAGEAQAALESATDTDDIFAVAGDTRRQAMAIGNQAAALDALGRLEEAEEAYQRSAALFTEIGEDKLRANVMQSLSQLQLRTGRQLEALATMQSGIEDIKRPSLRQRILKKLLKTPFKLLDR